MHFFFSYSYSSTIIFVIVSLFLKKLFYPKISNNWLYNTWNKNIYIYIYAIPFFTLFSFPTLFYLFFFSFYPFLSLFFFLYFIFFLEKMYNILLPCTEETCHCNFLYNIHDCKESKELKILMTTGLVIASFNSIVGK